MIPSSSTRVLTFDEFIKHSQDSLSLGNDPSEVAGLTDSTQGFESPTVDGEKVNTRGTGASNPLVVAKAKVTSIEAGASDPLEVVDVSDDSNDEDIDDDSGDVDVSDEDSDFDSLDHPKEDAVDDYEDAGVDDTDREPGEVW